MKEAYAVIGHPVGHTMSPFINAKLFALSHRDAEYKVLDIAPENIKNSISSLKKLSGFNITVPNKTEIFNNLDFADELAAAFCASNCVKVKEDKLLGFCTDGAGFIKALERENLKIPKTALLLGFGGAGRSVGITLSRLGTAVTVAVRTASVEKVKNEASRLCGNFTVCDINSISGEYDLLINATPVGMYPASDLSPVNAETVKKCGAVFDLIYNPGETKLMKTARALGIKAAGGTGMLVFQAVLSHEIWYGASFDEKDIEKLILDTEKETERLFSGNIVLVGFMGSGKTAVGKQLAKTLGADFSDTDDIVSEKHGDISEIFRTLGEDHFRKAESEAIMSLKGIRNTVIATGGGAVLNDENARILRSLGKTVYLKVLPETVKRRIDGDTGRPLYKSLAVKEMMEKREPRYLAAADITVTADGDMTETLKEILKALKKEEQI